MLTFAEPPHLRNRCLWPTWKRLENRKGILMNSAGAPATWRDSNATPATWSTARLSGYRQKLRDSFLRCRPSNAKDAHFPREHLTRLHDLCEVVRVAHWPALPFGSDGCFPDQSDVAGAIASGNLAPLSEAQRVWRTASVPRQMSFSRVMALCAPRRAFRVLGHRAKVARIV